MRKNYKVNGIDFLDYQDATYVRINQCGVEAIYPLKKVETKFPIQYVLMDLDGTTVKSEEFWIYLIECVCKEMLHDKDFKLSKEDEPFVSGFSTVEHLTYCKNKYRFEGSINDALNCYHRIARFELNEILEGRGNVNAFKPRTDLFKFLDTLKRNGIKIGLATSGLDYKAIPEIVSTFRILNLGDPLKFYDAVITGGRQKNGTEYGSIGELAVKPHPWIYSELALGLNVPSLENAIVIEDSSAGVISGRLASMNVIGFKDGNLYASGLDEECIFMADTFDDILNFLKLK